MSWHYDRPSVAPIGAGELAIQRACREAVSIAFDAEVWAIPNAAKRTRWAAARAKAEGLKTGAPDLVVIGGKANPGRVAFIEIKAKTSLTAEQRVVLDMLHAAGHNCGVFRSPGTLLEKLKEWGWK